MLNPDVVVIGGGVIAAGELLLGRRAPSYAPGARCRRRASTCGSCAARFGAESGMLGAAALAFDGLARRERPMTAAGRLVVCPTPIGNLEDVTLRVLSALRDADVVACEDTRRTRVLLERYGVSATLVSYHEHNERARATQLVERMRAGDVVALVSDAGTPLRQRPGLRAGARLRRGGARGRGAAGAERGAVGARGQRAAGRTRGASSGFLPRKRGELAALAARARRRSWRSSRPAGVAASLAVLARARRRRGRSPSAAS